MKPKKLMTILFALSLFLTGANLSASCAATCAADGAGIAAATGCIECGNDFTRTCMLIECQIVL